MAKTAPTPKPNLATWLRWRQKLRVKIWQWRYLLVALSAGLAATAVLETVAPPAPPQAAVVFAARDLPVGTTLQVEDLREVSLPVELTEGLVTDPAEVLGRVTITGLAANSPIWLSGISSADLGGVAPPGTMVVPLNLDAVTTSVLMPGDRVDLVSISTDNPQVLARAALVLPARLETSGGGGGLFGTAAPSSSVTLVAVTPDDAVQVTSAARLGHIAAILIP